MRPDRPDGAVHAALASRTRRHVLDGVARSAAPVDAHTIATTLGLHVTTVRFHLDRLEAARLVQRRSEPEQRRGRPRIRYVAAAGAGADSREQFIDVLAGVLSEREDGGRGESIEAGHRWAGELVPEGQHPGDAVGTLLRVLDDLGFDPLPDGEDVIRLRSCPFRDAAREHPQVVCSVHRGLVEQLLAGPGSDLRPELVPFVEPELCLVTLRRR